MPETVEKSMDGGWDATNAGGRRRIDQKNNPKWCRNPQYFLNLKQPTHLKVTPLLLLFFSFHLLSYATHSDPF